MRDRYFISMPILYLYSLQVQVLKFYRILVVFLSFDSKLVIVEGYIQLLCGSKTVLKLEESAID